MAPLPRTQQHSKKKKKGRAPAHQNTFAFHHNPGSKKTATILASPISGCCSRCHDKLAWRKQYRRYKPLTQPAICNVCHERKIRSAYHTRCADCRGDLCAVCAKEPPMGLTAAGNSHNGDDQKNELQSLSGKKLSLRQRKTLERKLANSNAETKKATDENSDEEEQLSYLSGGDMETDDLGSVEEDPFLQAAGGAVVTGAAYREQILRQQESDAMMHDTGS